MNLKTWAEENGHTLAEAKELTGLTHWNQSVPESCDEIPEVEEDVVLPEPVTTTAIETKSKLRMEDCPVGRRRLINSIQRLGKKSKYWEFRSLVGR